jgi:ion channel POLLUX/CASTOR
MSAGVEQEIADLAQRVTNQTVSFEQADTTSRQVLEALDLPVYDHVIILSYMQDMDLQRADSATIISLLHLRDLADKRNHQLAIVSEIIDIRNRDLVRVARVDDFIISDRLVSLALAQLSQNERVLDVFVDLFSPQGSEIYLKPAAEYVRLGQAVSFYTVLEAAKRRNETALGYRVHSEARDAGKHFGVHLNPAKSQMITLAEDDRLIVLAEAEFQSVAQ